MEKCSAARRLKCATVNSKLRTFTNPLIFYDMKCVQIFTHKHTHTQTCKRKENCGIRFIIKFFISCLFY